MIKDKEQRRISRKMSKINGKAWKGGLSTVMIVENGVETHKTREHKIVAECINEARARFTETRNTPFMWPPLVNNFGYMARTRAAQEVWDGKYKAPQGMDKYAVRLLKELEIPKRIRDGPQISEGI